MKSSAKYFGQAVGP